MNTSATVVEALIARHISITTMESCTSGLIASMITDTEGASAVFRGAEVTYCNEAKVAAGVDSGVIERYGVYSPQCAEAMALAAQRSFGADIAVGVTGSTGNVDPLNAGSVVGEVFYCIVMGGAAHSFHYTTDVTGKCRRDIKLEYASRVFESLATLMGVCG